MTDRNAVWAAAYGAKFASFYMYPALPEQIAVWDRESRECANAAVEALGEQDQESDSYSHVPTKIVAQFRREDYPADPCHKCGTMLCRTTKPGLCPECGQNQSESAQPQKRTKAEIRSNIARMLRESETYDGISDKPQKRRRVE